MIERCWNLWTRTIITVRYGEMEYSRVIACQREPDHAGEHHAANDWFEVWWNRETQCSGWTK
jgi:hypothetical protein